MIKLFIIGLGIFLCSMGLMFMVLYSNLIVMGYSFFEYVNVISKRWECLIVFIGVLFIIFGLKGKRIREILLRFISKH